jgi:hypothetical protein
MSVLSPNILQRACQFIQIPPFMLQTRENLFELGKIVIVIDYFRRMQVDVNARRA